MSPSAVLRAPAWVVCLAIVAGCDAGSNQSETVVVRDSAGITIIENYGPAWTDEDRWVVQPEAAVTIGQIQGDAEYLLQQVGSPLRLSDGRIVLLNRGTNEVRFYDAQGKHLFSKGGRGSGPGEYVGLVSMFRMDADSLFLVDITASRYTVLTADGEVNASYDADWRSVNASGRLSNGNLVRTIFADPTRMHTLGYVRIPSDIVLADPVTGAEDTVAVVPGSEEFRYELDGGAALASNGTPFGRRQQLFVRGDRIYTGAGDAFEIEVRRADGSIERLIRATHPVRAVTEEDIGSWRNSQLESAGNSRFRPDIERYVREVPVAETMPAYAQLQVDAANNLWVRDYAPEWETSDLWQVFDPNGRWLGTMQLPEGLEVTDIGEEYVLGIHRDDLGVESVRLHRLEKRD